LPEGNQAGVLEATRREALSGAELAGVVDLWLGCAERRQQDYLLRHLREALSQVQGALSAVHDPRLREDGNRVWKRVGLLLDVSGRMEVWLAHHNRTGLGARARTTVHYDRCDDDISLDEVERVGILLTGEHLHQHRRDGLCGSCRCGAELANETLSVDRPNLIECHLAMSVLKRDADTCRIQSFSGGHRGNDDGT